MHSAYRDLVDLVADGTLSARVDRTMRLEDWKDALILTHWRGGQGFDDRRLASQL